MSGFFNFGTQKPAFQQALDAIEVNNIPKAKRILDKMLAEILGAKVSDSVKEDAIYYLLAHVADNAQKRWQYLREVGPRFDFEKYVQSLHYDEQCTQQYLELKLAPTAEQLQACINDRKEAVPGILGHPQWCQILGVSNDQKENKGEKIQSLVNDNIEELTKKRRHYFYPEFVVQAVNEQLAKHKKHSATKEAIKKLNSISSGEKSNQKSEDIVELIDTVLTNISDGVLIEYGVADKKLEEQFDVVKYAQWLKEKDNQKFETHLEKAVATCNFPVLLGLLAADQEGDVIAQIDESMRCATLVSIAYYCHRQKQLGNNYFTDVFANLSSAVLSCSDGVYGSPLAALVSEGYDYRDEETVHAVVDQFLNVTFATSQDNSEIKVKVHSEQNDHFLHIIKSAIETGIRCDQPGILEYIFCRINEKNHIALSQSDRLAAIKLCLNLQQYECLNAVAPQFFNNPKALLLYAAENGYAHCLRYVVKTYYENKQDKILNDENINQAFIAAARFDQANCLRYLIKLQKQTQAGGAIPYLKTEYVVDLNYSERQDNQKKESKPKTAFDYAKQRGDFRAIQVFYHSGRDLPKRSSMWLSRMRYWLRHNLGTQLLIFLLGIGVTDLSLYLMIISVSALVWPSVLATMLITLGGGVLSVIGVAIWRSFIPGDRSVSLKVPQEETAIEYEAEEGSIQGCVTAMRCNPRFRTFLDDLGIERRVKQPRLYKRHANKVTEQQEYAALVELVRWSTRYGYSHILEVAIENLYKYQNSAAVQEIKAEGMGKLHNRLNSAIFEAIRYRRYDCLRILVNAKPKDKLTTGDDPLEGDDDLGSENKSVLININCTNKHGMSPYTMAVLSGDSAATQIIFDCNKVKQKSYGTLWQQLKHWYRLNPKLMLLSTVVSGSLMKLLLTSLGAAIGMSVWPITLMIVFTVLTSLLTTCLITFVTAYLGSRSNIANIKTYDLDAIASVELDAQSQQASTRVIKQAIEDKSGRGSVLLPADSESADDVDGKGHQYDFTWLCSQVKDSKSATASANLPERSNDSLTA